MVKAKSKDQILTSNIAIEYLPLEDLIPSARNARTHSKKQIGQIARSIKKFGFNNPILISDDKTIIAGHGRCLGAERLKLKAVPCVRLSHLSEDERRAYMIADNQIALKSEWDIERLSFELKDLQSVQFDLTPIGFDDEELEKLLATDEKETSGGGGLTDPDDIPEAPKEPKTKLGDLYILGNHRLLCGDSTNREHVDRLMDGIKPILMVTDPPYGVTYDATWRNEAVGERSLGKNRTGKVLNDDRADWFEVWDICVASIAYVWHASAFSDVVMDSLRRADFEVRQQIIWNKSVMAMSRSAYHWKHEPCWYAVRKGCDANWKGDRKQTTIWEAASPTHIMSGSKEEKTPHPTQKPAVLYEIPIENHTVKGDAIYEPFAGSGTAVIAAEKLGRRCLMMELNPTYCDVILERWSKFTGREPQLVEQ